MSSSSSWKKIWRSRKTELQSDLDIRTVLFGAATQRVGLKWLKGVFRHWNRVAPTTDILYLKDAQNDALHEFRKENEKKWSKSQEICDKPVISLKNRTLL